MKTLKKIAMTFLLTAYFTMAFSNKYTDAMQQNLSKMYKARTTEELSTVSSLFYRISQAEGDTWLPLYYASLSLVRVAYFIQDGEIIDQHLDQAQEYLDILLKENPDESELHVLQGLLYSMRITNPSRGMKYSMLSNGSLDKAKELDASNPRVYYCKGNNVYHTPSFFGGGKNKALPLFTKANELFKQWQSPQAFWPNWGSEHNTKMITNCTKED